MSRAIVLGTLGVLAGLALLVGLAWAAGHDKIDPSNLGDRELWAGNADRLADRVAKDGPFILPDLSPGKDRVVYLQHLGKADAKGWFTILANAAGCALTWTGSGFHDCHDRAFPADGTGLTRYRTWVRDNGVYVDLRTTVP
jgi:hypothetical protein